MPRRKKSLDKDKDKKARGKTGMRRHVRRLKADTVIDFRDAGLLRKFMTEHGKIVPGRLNGANSKQQRLISRAIRRARVLGFV